MLDEALKYFYQKSFIAKSRDIVLFSLIFDDRLKQNSIDEFFSGYDIENEPHEFNVYLSNLLSERKDLVIPEKFQPRLSGLRKWHRFHNVTLLAEYVSLTKKLSEKGIFPILIKGAAIRGYIPHVVRHMWDLDCYVLPKDYPEAVKIALNEGWEILGEPIHSCDLGKGSCHLDIHKGFASQKFSVETLEEAKDITLSGNAIKIPNLERLVYILLINAYKNLSEKYTYHSNMTWAFDLGFIIRKYDCLSWEKIVSISKEEKSEYMVWIMLSLLEKVFPNAMLYGIRHCLSMLDAREIESRYSASICSSISGREALDLKDAVKLKKTWDFKYIKSWMKYSIMRLSQKKRIPGFFCRSIGIYILKKNDCYESKDISSYSDI